MQIDDLLLGLCIGVGLSAACGFRVFVPMLVMSLAARSGHLTLAEGFQWIGATPALWAFAVATALEISAYYIPWLDNLLDSVATPAAVVAGTIVTASFVADLHPLMQWSLALVAGGGAAAAVQGVTVVSRAASTMLTGGLGNPAISTAEAGASAILAVLAIVLPILAGLLVLAAVYFILSRLWRRNCPARQMGEVDSVVSRTR